MNPIANESTAVSVLANRLMKAGPPGVAKTVTVGASSILLLAENLTRSSLVLVNCHATQRVSFYLALVGEQDIPAAVLDSGITLFALGGVWEMDPATFTTGAIYAIASGAGTKVAIQEFS